MENITETVVNEAAPVIEATTDAAAKAIAQPKAPMSFGKKTLIVLGGAAVVGGIYWAGKKIHTRFKDCKAKEKADAQGYDNVDIAKRDFLDDPEEDTAEE